jgi:hypothetical protein
MSCARLGKHLTYVYHWVGKNICIFIYGCNSRRQAELAANCLLRVCSLRAGLMSLFGHIAKRCCHLVIFTRYRIFFLTFIVAELPFLPIIIRFHSYFRAFPLFATNGHPRKGIARF